MVIMVINNYQNILNAIIQNLTNKKNKFHSLMFCDLRNKESCISHISYFEISQVKFEVQSQ